MASAVVYDDVAEGASVATGALFEGYKFWVAQRVPIRASYLAKIEANGGQVVKLEKQADFLIADHFRRDCPPGSISYEFIEKSITQGRILDPDNFSAGPRVGTSRDVGSIARPAKGTRAAYTPEEDRQLYKWVRDAERNGVAISGNELYKQLEQRNPRHTWQSWRDRYLKKLQYTPPDAWNVPDNAPPSPPSDQSSRAAEVPVRRTGPVQNKDGAGLDGVAGSASMGTAASKGEAGSKVGATSTEHTTEPPLVKRTGLVKNKDKARTSAATLETVTSEANTGRELPGNSTQPTASDPSSKELSIDQLAATFSTEDWEDLYAFVEHIDAIAANELSYETSWTNWAENKDNQTPQQWRQYYEKVVRPQWLSDPVDKRDRIKRKVEERHANDSSSPTNSQSQSQTQGAGAASQKEIQEDDSDAPSKARLISQRTVSNTLPSDSRLESEATAQQETPQYIRNGYEAALKRIRGNENEIQAAAIGSTDAGRPTKMRKYSLSPSPEIEVADRVNGKQEQPLEISSRASSQHGDSEQLATEDPTRPRTQQRGLQIIDLDEEEESEVESEAPEQSEQLAAGTVRIVPGPGPKRLSEAPEESRYFLFPPGYVEWVELRDAAISAGLSIEDAGKMATHELSLIMASGEQASQGNDDGDETTSEHSGDELESLAPIPRPHAQPRRSSGNRNSEELEENNSDLESVASSTDLTHIAPLPRPQQIPEASDDDENDDDLPSNAPTPRANRSAAFDTQAILSPSQNAPLTRLPRPIDSSPPHHPESEASTTQSLQEFSSYLQDAEDPGVRGKGPVLGPARPTSPTPSATSEASLASDASDASTGAGDPDPPLDGEEMDDFFAEQNAEGFSDEHITKALRRTRFRPGLAMTVLEAWRNGRPLPDKRGIWSLDEDELVESGDGAALAMLGRKHTVDGWGGITERMNFLSAWSRR